MCHGVAGSACAGSSPLIVQFTRPLSSSCYTIADGPTKLIWCVAGQRSCKRVCVCVSRHRAIGSSMTIGYHAQKGRGITANFSIGAAPTGAPTAGPTADPTADPTAGPTAGPTTAPSPVPTTLNPSVLAGFEFNVVLTPSITLYWCVSVCVCVLFCLPRSIVC